MGIEVFLGEPPQHIKEWIINNSKPAGNPKTKITFTDGTSQEYDWSGKITYRTMKDAGLAENNAWIKQPQTVEIGTNVTSIGNYTFEDCSSLTSVTIPDSVTSIGDYAFNGCERMKSVTIGNGVTSIGYRVFTGCSSLTSVTFSGKDKATVTGIGTDTEITYPWSLASGCVIHCTDGDITIQAKE